MSETLEIYWKSLSESQRRLWPELEAVPPEFVLYGGTAVVLRHGHRFSLDFDFFSSAPFEAAGLLARIPWLAAAKPLQSQSCTFTAVVERHGPVKVSFFGGLSLGRVGVPQRTADGVILVASALDLAATKLAVIQQRAEAKDYLDVDELLRSGVSLAQALGAARALYGGQFNPAISLKALCYFGDGDLPRLSAAVQQRLAGAAAAIGEIQTVPRLADTMGC
jgi:hypothetical protein